MAGSVLHTERCTLRPWTHDDAASVGRLLREPSVRRHLLDDQLVDPNWVRARIDESQGRFGDGGFGVWGVHRSGSAIGFVGFLPVPGRAYVELTYGLHPGHTGQGLATEAARRVVILYQAVVGGTVHASIDAPNVASRRVLERLGFRVSDHTPPDGHRPAQVHFELHTALTA